MTGGREPGAGSREGDGRLIPPPAAGLPAGAPRIEGAGLSRAGTRPAVSDALRLRAASMRAARDAAGGMAVEPGAAVGAPVRRSVRDPAGF